MILASCHSFVRVGTGTAAQSPFVIAIERAGVRGTYCQMTWRNQFFDSSLLVFPHIINACVFSSAFSSGNTILFGASRILYGLSLRGQAPQIFTRCTKDGLPFIAVLVSVRGATLMFCFIACWWVRPPLVSSPSWPFRMGVRQSSSKPFCTAST